MDAAELARGLEHLRRRAMAPVVVEETTLRLPEESPKFKRFLKTRARSSRRRRRKAAAQQRATLAMTCPSSSLNRSMYMDPEGVAAVWGPEAHVLFVGHTPFCVDTRGLRACQDAGLH